MRIITLSLCMILVAPALADTYKDLEIADEHNTPAYKRSLYKDGSVSWIDADGDGENTREEVLAEEKVGDVWVCPFTGRIFTNASDLDIDHIVPLKEAHLSGGHAWTKAERVAYANDLENPDHLMAVYDRANQSKGSKDPASWMPPNRSYWCAYLEDWIAIKLEYDLTVDQDEVDAMKIGFANCEKYSKRDAINGLH